MALIVKTLTMPYGVEFKDVYFKINRLSYNDENHELYFAGAFYLNKEARLQEMQPIENGILCEVIGLEDKTVNLYEYIYNHIKAKALEIEQLSDEEIMKHNQEVQLASAMANGPITGLINPNYKLFLDAEDC
jgi:hypothetical protein